MTQTQLVRLFKLRLLVARYGESDRLRWWSSTGVLAATGKAVYSRGLPRTQLAARARVAFAAAAVRCDELVPANPAFHLFRLPPDVEALTDELLLSGNSGCGEAIDTITSLPPDLPFEAALNQTAGIATTVTTAIKSIQLPTAARAFAVDVGQDLAAGIEHLAAGFLRSGHSSPIVPYLTVHS